jgi:arabinan endo-1,5-alpha-L-arabinosidase
MKTIYTFLSFMVFAASLNGQPCDFSAYEPPQVFDTYHELVESPDQWSGFNVHDPSAIKVGDWYYLYNTDVSMGGYDVGTGTMVRKSQDLINWEFLGTAFNGVPQSAVDYFLQHNPSYTDQGIWAPFIMEYQGEYRLYYSAPGAGVGPNLGFLGYATSSSPAGPWTDKGRIVVSSDGDAHNAIDPSVVIDQQTGEHWMVYGSYQSGLYMLQLDPATGGALTPGNIGHKVAARSGGMHAAIEGPELTYRNGWYYLFVSYDWLEDFYNVRVGRSQNPEGPYLDFNGNDLADYSDNEPMIVAPYRFNHHMGWQGTGHNGIYNDNGQYYIFHQGRPSTSIYNMDLHVRKIHWIDDWPVASPQRYAAVPQCTISESDMAGDWEQILLVYDKSKPHATSMALALDESGTINGEAGNTWSLNGNTLTLSWANGTYIDTLYVEWVWDWELRRITLAFTGMNQFGLNIWGKKVDADAVNAVAVVESGSVYIVRNHNSNKVLEVSGGVDDFGANIIQNSDNGSDAQKWRITADANGYFTFTPLSSSTGKYMEVAFDSGNNGANIRLGNPDVSSGKLFKMEYQDNGYFGIVSQASGDIRGLDVSSFSVDDGASVVQWDFASTNNNQLWRIEKTDENVSSSDLTGQEYSTIMVSPNPVGKESVNINLQKMPQGEDISILIFNSAGQVIERFKGAWRLTYKTRSFSQSGIYFISVQSGDVSVTERVLVY